MQDTDTTAVDNQQLAAIMGHLQAQQQQQQEEDWPPAALMARISMDQTLIPDLPITVQQAVHKHLIGKGFTAARDQFGDRFYLPPKEEAAVPEQRDEQWAGPSLPHPSEATSEQEHDDLSEAWDNWAKGIDPNQLAEGHYDEAEI